MIPVLPTDTEEQVIADISRRRDVGRAKYGKSLERTDLTERQWLQHHYEELLDAALYCKRRMNLMDQQNQGGGQA